MSDAHEGDPAHTLYDQIAQELAATHQSVAGKMFGMDVMKINGKAFAGFFRGAMNFKLTGAQHTAALSLEGSKLFDPGDMQRPMKEWVVVPVAHSKEWHRFAESALEYVESLAEKPKSGGKRKPKSK